MRHGAFVAGAALVLLVVPAAARADDRAICPDRPGLGTAACTVAPGHVSVETGLVDWSRSGDADSQTDDIVIAETLVRVGMTSGAELIVGWTPYGVERIRDKHDGRVTHSGAAGDVTLGGKVNLHNPDGSGFSVAVQPFVTLPVGRSPVGAGDWGAGVVLPISYDLGHGLSAAFTGEVDAAVDSDGAGRHLAYSGVWGLGVAVTHSLSATAEIEAARDQDPAGHSSATYAALSLAWTRGPHLQLDVGGAAGLDRAATGAEIYAGISRLF